MKKILLIIVYSVLGFVAGILLGLYFYVCFFVAVGKMAWQWCCRRLTTTD